MSANKTHSIFRPAGRLVWTDILLLAISAFTTSLWFIQKIRLHGGRGRIASGTAIENNTGAHLREQQKRCTEKSLLLKNELIFKIPPAGRNDIVTRN